MKEPVKTPNMNYLILSDEELEELFWFIKDAIKSGVQETAFIEKFLKKI